MNSVGLILPTDGIGMKKHLTKREFLRLTGALGTGIAVYVVPNVVTVAAKPAFAAGTPQPEPTPTQTPPRQGVVEMATGRVNQVNLDSVMYAAPSGITSITSTVETERATLSAARAGKARNLAVKIAVGALKDDKSFTFTLMVNGAPSAVQCGLTTPTTNSDSGANFAAVPAGADLSLRIEYSPANSDHGVQGLEFGWIWEEL